MFRNKTFNRRKLLIVFTAVMLVLAFLAGRLVYLMVFCSEYYGQKAEDLHERERDIIIQYVFEEQRRRLRKE